MSIRHIWGRTGQLPRAQLREGVLGMGVPGTEQQQPCPNHPWCNTSLVVTTFPWPVVFHLWQCMSPPQTLAPISSKVQGTFLLFSLQIKPIWRAHENQNHVGLALECQKRGLGGFLAFNKWILVKGSSLSSLVHKERVNLPSRVP